MQFESMIIIALAVATISVTITKTHIFQRFRSLIDQQIPQLSKVIHCPYCFSHWVALVLYLLYHPLVISGWGMLDYVISYFALVATAAIWSLFICGALLAMEALGTAKLSQKGGEE